MIGEHYLADGIIFITKMIGEHYPATAIETIEDDRGTVPRKND